MSGSERYHDSKRAKLSYSPHKRWDNPRNDCTNENAWDRLKHESADKNTSTTTNSESNSGYKKDNVSVATSTFFPHDHSFRRDSSLNRYDSTEGEPRRCFQNQTSHMSVNKQECLSFEKDGGSTRYEIGPKQASENSFLETVSKSKYEDAKTDDLENSAIQYPSNVYYGTKRRTDCPNKNVFDLDSNVQEDRETFRIKEEKRDFHAIRNVDSHSEDIGKTHAKYYGKGGSKLKDSLTVTGELEPSVCQKANFNYNIYNIPTESVLKPYPPSIHAKCNTTSCSDNNLKESSNSKINNSCSIEQVSKTCLQEKSSKDVSLKDNPLRAASLKNLVGSRDKNKQGFNPEITSMDGGSQVNRDNKDGVTTSIVDELSEESKLIQMNPALREFDILDDLEESENEGEARYSNSTEEETDVSEELPIEDVDAMLEEGLPSNLKGTGKHVSKLRHKVILKEIGYDHFDLLPEGWIQIMHSSGMPVYLHQKSRVCTMARPYYLGPGSSRNHKVPLSAIPCLQYKRALESEKKNEEEKNKNSEQAQNQPEIQLMAAKIETSEENEAAQSLEALDLREYCQKVFNFKTVSYMPFKSWADRRKYVRMTKDLKKRQRPSLPDGTKLLKFPIQNPDGTNSRSKGEWIINPNGKSYVCILHEYVQHALKKHPKYQFKELENPATPYSATVFIEDMQYSVGMGASKKQAKVEAAKAALEVLIPEMKEKIERDSQFGMRSGIAQRSQNSDISIFDQIRVEDPRVAEFCAKTTEPPPYAILLTCLSRNMGLGDIKVNYEMNSKKHKEDEFTMQVGNHKATVVCKNKRDGKQRAAQAILQALHPNITHWGSLLRMYGNRSIKNVKEKKQEEQEITGLQSKASLNQPNFAILEKLRTEMLKLKDKRDAIKAKGKFIPPENVILPSLSSTDLNKVNF